MRKWIGYILIAVLLLAGASAVWAWLRHDYPAHHFAAVREGVLYRSGQPPEGRWSDVYRRTHMKTVISVREIKPQAPWYIEEERFCREHGIELIRMPFLEQDFDEAHLREFVALVMDPKRQPVLVHCEMGSRRTGLAVAAYRILAEGWDVDRAVAEATHLRFVPEPNAESVALLRRLTAPASAASQSAESVNPLP
jgi:protein tyrosine/serine phosphatase